MVKKLPPPFLERLKNILPDEHYGRVVQSFSEPLSLNIRINTIKISKKDLLGMLRRENIVFEELPWAHEGLVLRGVDPARPFVTDAVAKGLIYRQGVSSMIPVVVLDPKPGEQVLDMCAAPGGKAAQMAARMNNEGSVVAVEAVRGRYYKLLSVIRLMGASNVTCRLADARRTRFPSGLFDKILVDAPCSSEGRFKLTRPKSFAYWSPRKSKEISRKQKGLVWAAARLLKPGGRLAYSTCTFAPEENEEVVDWLLRKSGGALEAEPVCLSGAASYPTLSGWRGKTFDPSVKKCLRVLPGENYEGFFVASIKKSAVD